MMVGGQLSAVGGQRSMVRFEITDLFGRVIMRFEDNVVFPYIIDVAALSPGMYILHMNSEEGLSGSAKFLKVDQ
jgi:hypothetical protein